METWHYITNQFEGSTRGSFKRMNILASDHQSKLTAQGTDPDIAALVARTLPLATAYGTAYTGSITANATYKGHTQLGDSLLAQLSNTKIKQWDIQIQNVFLEGTAEYTMILPNMRGPFQKGGKDQRQSEVEALAQRLLAYPALATTQADVAAFFTTLKTARDNQQQKEQLAATASSQLELARVALAVMMYGNLGVLMDKYRETPDMVGNFWQLDLIRDAASGGTDDDDLPDNSVTISGKVMNQTTGTPLANVSVVAFDSATGPGTGSIEVFTNAEGLYEIVIEDLPGAYLAGMQASLTGYMTQMRNLNIEPGNDYPGEDFSLSPMP